MTTVARHEHPMFVLLAEKDMAAVEDLYARCADYFLLQDGQVADRSDAAELFQDVPPEKNPEDLVVFGLVGKRGLDAVAAMLRDYPANSVWYLPFIVIDPGKRGRGLGRAFYKALEQWATERGAREIRLVALEANPNGERFWRSMGFDEIRRVGPHTFKQKSHRRIEFNRPVDPTPLTCRKS